jgi:hypothetical protein
MTSSSRFSLRETGRPYVQKQSRKRMQKQKKASKRPLLACILNRLNLYGQEAYRFEY